MMVIFYFLKDKKGKKAKNHLNTDFTQKNNSKWIVDLKVKYKTIQLLGEFR